MYVFFYVSPTFNIALKGKCFHSGGMVVNFYFFNLRLGFYCIYEFGNVLKNTGMLELSLSIGQLGICFPEGFDLSFMSSSLPV